MVRIASYAEAGPRYGILRLCAVGCSLLGSLLLVLGVLLLGLAAFSVLAGLQSGGPPGGGPVAWIGFGAIAFFVWSIGLIGAGLQFVGLGALIRLMIHLEENTRASARFLARLAEPPGPGGGPGFVS